MNPFVNTMILQKQRAEIEMPTNVMLGLSERCVATCPFCPLQQSEERLKRVEGDMSWELFRKIVDELSTRPPEVLRLHGSGEATINKDFGRMGRYAREKLPETWLQMNTVGTTWSSDAKRKEWLEIGLNKLTFSMEANRWLQDGLDAGLLPWDRSIPRDQVRFEYKKYVIHPHRAGAPWKIVAPNLIATARALARLKKESGKDAPVQRTNLCVQHVVTREQEVVRVRDADGRERATSWEIEFSTAFWRQYGVQVQYVPVATVGGQVDNSDMLNEEYMREPMGHCREVYTNFVIGWDGKVSPCCVNEHELTLCPEIDLAKMTVNEAFNHPRLQHLRALHRKHADSKGEDAAALPGECTRCLKAL